MFYTIWNQVVLIDPCCINIILIQFRNDSAVSTAQIQNVIHFVLFVKIDQIMHQIIICNVCFPLFLCPISAIIVFIILVIVF